VLAVLWIEPVEQAGGVLHHGARSRVVGVERAQGVLVEALAHLPGQLSLARA
jgi:hypothetical protein